MNLDVEDFLFSKLEVAGECWLWEGSYAGSTPTFNRYDAATKKNINLSTRKTLWTVVKGEDPGYRIINACGNIRCVRPEHSKRG